MGAVKTITIYPVRSFKDGQEQFSKKAARQILGISHVQTFNRHLETLGIPNRSLTWEDIKLVLEVKLFLYDRLGGNTSQMYRAMKVAGHIPGYFAQMDIDPEAQFERLKRRYESKHPLAGTVRYYPAASTNSSKAQKPVTAVV